MYQIDFSTPSHVHFIGIGGISMSALAELLFKRGFTVSGSDVKQSPLTERLSHMGITIYYGQKATNLTNDITFAVYTAAVHADNEEFAAAKEADIPLLERAELLGQLTLQYPHTACVAGTHGKTSTTSLLSTMLLEAKLDPTIMVGGVLDAIGGNLHIGSQDYFVIEACEYTNSFLKFHPSDIIITNIEAEHLDFFKDLDDIRGSFCRFISLLPEHGTLVLQGDIENQEQLRAAAKSSCTVLTYGISKEGNPSAYDYTAVNITFNEQGFPSYDLYAHGTFLGKMSLHVTGEHNVQNSVAATALALQYGAELEAIQTALLSYAGTHRRFEYRGTVQGFSVYDDYAHHPTEITATLRAAANCHYRELWCVFQPHTYSRTRAFLDDFAESLSLADHIVLTDIYSAREVDPGDISSAHLAKKLKERGKDVHHIGDFAEIETFLKKNCYPDDLLIIMGAGDVVSISNSLTKK